MIEFRIKEGSLRNSNISLGRFPISGPTMESTIFSASETSKPFIMIGPGTGVAPMRSLIQDYFGKSRLSSPSSPIQSQRNYPELMLVFGCRKKTMDYLYGNEWDAINLHASYEPLDYKTGEKRTLSELLSLPEVLISSNMSVITAFSQDQAKKFYVTHAIKDNGSVIWNMLQVEVRKPMLKCYLILIPSSMYTGLLSIRVWICKENACRCSESSAGGNTGTW